MNEESEYECPDCGAALPKDSLECPQCGAEFAREDEEESVEEILEEIAEQPEGPNEEASKVPEEAVEEEYKVVPKEEVLEEPEEILPDEIPKEHPPVGPKLYGGLFSILGLTFVVLTFLALIATNLALCWDTWINGAAEETIGDHQRFYIYLGVAGIVVCVVVSVVDILRHRKGHRG